MAPESCRVVIDPSITNNQFKSKSPSRLFGRKRAVACSTASTATDALRHRNQPDVEMRLPRPRKSLTRMPSVREDGSRLT